jgi:CBS domain containing-hemolysin-like protein
LNNARLVFAPIVFLVTSVGRVILLPFGKTKTPWELTFTKRDLKGIVLSGKEAGEVEHDEAELIHKVLDFGAKTVENIMIPLYRVASISAGDSIENLKKLVSINGFSRIPVYQDNKDDIVGVVNIYDVLFAQEEKNRIVDFLREPVHVKESDGIDIALTRLRRQKQPMGIVQDKDQNVVGIVTIEDILEEIVGEIEEKG